mmetsp:Transcript_15619/g.23667  ORF Transcript_15619/g.23667 Transcript_15619/m.23667 type:complete len:85 (-) Transcript_15619:38-292(-)
MALISVLSAFGFVLSEFEGLSSNPFPLDIERHDIFQLFVTKVVGEKQLPPISFVRKTVNKILDCICSLVIEKRDSYLNFFKYIY